MENKKRDPLTEFGKEMALWCAEKDISKKALARRAGVKYDTMMQAARGRCPGRDTVRKVRDYMRHYDDGEAIA